MRQIIFFFLRHTVLLLILGYLALGYLYRGPIFGWEVSAEAEPAPAVGQPNSTPVKPEPAPAAKTADTEPAPPTQLPSPVEPSPQGKDLQAMLQQARRLADGRQYEAAEAAYLQMIEAFPTLAEPYGELGNLYLAIDQPGKAAQAYLDAGKRIDFRLNPSQAEGLLQTLQTLSPEKATLLKEHFSKP